MNNTEKTLKNCIISVVAQVATLLLQFINRRIFILFLDIEFLGYQTLFTTLFSFLSMAELGIGNIIAFRLYKYINEGNESEIGKLMYLFKWLYRLVAGVVLLSGLACFFFLPYFVHDAKLDWSYIELIYVLQLASVVAGFFLSYRRTIFIAKQQEYRCVRTDLYVNVVIQVLQIVFLAITRNFLVYLGIQLSAAIIANSLIYRRTSIEYPYLKNKFTVTFEDIRKRNIIKDIKNFFFHQISYGVYNSTDSIVISAFCGVRTVALYGNYLVIQKGVLRVLFYRLLNALQATIGNIVHSNRSKDELWEQFKTLDVFSFFFATYVGLGFLLFFQPFMCMWLGAEYLLSDMFVILFSLTMYLTAVWEIVYRYRMAFGDYEQDRNFMIISAVLNLLISIPGAKYYGIEGVQFGTLIAFLPIALGRIRFIVQNYFGHSMRKYIFRHFCLMLVVLVEGTIGYLLCKDLPVSIAGFCLRGFIWLLLPLILNTMVCFPNPYFKKMIVYIKCMIRCVIEKRKI